MIDSYAFGRMVIGGVTYTSDLIIFPGGRVVSPWWRLSGHRLQTADIMELLDAGPDIIVVGTGASGFMRSSNELQELLASRGIDFICEPSSRAYRTYNLLDAAIKTGACFHLTC